MKKVINIIFLLLAFSVISNAQQIINGDFENWGVWTINNGLTNTDYDTATAWTNYFDIDVGGTSSTIFTAQKSTDAFHGTYAVQLKTIDNNGLVIPGMIQMGVFESDQSSNVSGLKGGQAFTARPTGISAYVKYTPANNDTGFVYSYLTHWNGTSADTIAVALYPLLDTLSTYTKIEFPYFYKNGDDPDTINIAFSSSSITSPKVGSTMILDSVSVINHFVAYSTLALPASMVTSNSFYAKWEASPLSNEYYLDVATDEQFTNLIIDNQLVTFATQSSPIDSFLVDVSGASYPLYYRVRVKYGTTAVSENSNSVSVIYSNPSELKKIVKYSDFKVKNKMLFLYNLEPNSVIQVFTISGQELYSQKSNDKDIIIPFRLPGIYVLKISDSHTIKKAKFSIE